MNKIFIIVDVESTCYSNDDKTKPTDFKNEIIEIGAVKCDYQGNTLDEFDMFLKPKKHPFISKFCTELTTIKQDDIDFAETARYGLKTFFNWTVHDSKLISDVKYVSWGHYDKNQFQYDLQINLLDKNLINDTNHYSLKHLHGEWNGLKKPLGLGSACKFEKITFEGQAHRGISDARMVAKIFQKYVHKINAL